MDYRRSFGRLAKLTLLCVGLAAAESPAATPGGPVPIEQAKGKTGQFDVTLSQRSPLSKPADVAARTSQKLGPGDTDYDLSKETFVAYAPKSAGQDGKYGLMVGFLPADHGFPALPWTPVLEKHHLLWLGNPHRGDGRSLVQRVGLALDAAYDAQKVWPIDERRVYLCVVTNLQFPSGIGLFYPDVFPGELVTVDWSWYEKLPDPGGRTMWNTDGFPRPHAQQLELAREQSRIFLAGRTKPVPAGHTNPMELIVKNGYERAGFKHVKAIFVPPADMNLYSHFAADWFEQAVEFLDTIPPASEAASQPVAAAAARPPEPVPPPPAAAPKQPAAAATAPPPAPDDAAKKAESALSLAKSYITAERFDSARAKLQSILESYPNTPAAVEAKTLLKEIQDK